MTEQQLQAAEAAYREAAEAAEKARKDRNAAVVAALDEGIKLSEVARLTGLSKTRMGQIRAADTVVGL